MLSYEEHDLKLWIVNTENFEKIIKNNLDDFGTFRSIAYNIYVNLKKKEFIMR